MVDDLLSLPWKYALFAQKVKEPRLDTFGPRPIFQDLSTRTSLTPTIDGHSMRTVPTTLVILRSYSVMTILVLKGMGSVVPRWVRSCEWSPLQVPVAGTDASAAGAPTAALAMRAAATARWVEVLRTLHSFGSYA